MPQFSVTQNAIPAQPGMAFDAEVSDRDVVSIVAAVNIPFGVYCELTSTGLAQPMQDSGTTSSFVPNSIGISMYDPLGVEQNYVTWALSTSLSGTASVVNGSARVVFSTTQSLAQGQPLVFSSQPGVQYFVQQATTTSNQCQLTANYGGTTNGAATVTEPGQGSTTSGWKEGTAVPFMRRGRIWVAGDASGTAQQYGAINVHHSSNGTNPQGVFTFLAASAASGNEIDVAPNCTVWNPGKTYNAQYNDPFGNVFSLYVVEINL